MLATSFEQRCRPAPVLLPFLAPQLNVHSLPVVDSQGRCLGIVTCSDLVEALGEDWGSLGGSGLSVSGSGTW